MMAKLGVGKMVINIYDKRITRKFGQIIVNAGVFQTGAINDQNKIKMQIKETFIGAIAMRVRQIAQIVGQRMNAKKLHLLTATME